MPGYAAVHPVVGMGPVNDLLIPDTNQRFVLGQVIDAVDAYFGMGRFMYLRYPVSTAVAPGRLLTIVDQTFLTVDLANTANLGYPFVVARQNAASNAAAQFGWFQFEGITPVQTAASVAAGVAVGIGAAGQAGTNSAGKQLLGVKVLQASTFTIVKNNCQTINGSPVIGVPNVDGLFVGLTITLTGASGTILTIDPSGRFITLSANSTITGTANATFTYTGFLLVHLNTPMGQGAIT